MAARFNLEWMSKEEYKDWLLTEDSGNTKAICKTLQKNIFFIQHGRTFSEKSCTRKEASESHTEKWEESLSDGFFWKKEQVAEASTSKESGKPSTLVMGSSGEQKSSYILLWFLLNRTIILAVRQAFARIHLGFFQVWGKCCSILFQHQMVYWCLYTLRFNLGIYKFISFNGTC